MGWQQPMSWFRQQLHRFLLVIMHWAMYPYFVHFFIWAVFQLKCLQKWGSEVHVENLWKTMDSHPCFSGWARKCTVLPKLYCFQRGWIKNEFSASMIGYALVQKPLSGVRKSLGSERNVLKDIYVLWHNCLEGHSRVYHLYIFFSLQSGFSLVMFSLVSNLYNWGISPSKSLPWNIWFGL